MYFSRIFFILSSLFFFVFPSTGHTQHVEQLYDDNTTIDLSSSLYYLYETDIPLTINDIIRRQSDFRIHPYANPNFGFKNQGVWLHTSVANLANQKDWVFSIDFSQLEKVDFYLVKNGQLLKQSHQGKFQTEQNYRVPTFRVSLPDSEKVSLFIRVESRASSLITPVKIQTQSAHSAATQIDSLMWGLFYGGLLILAVYNLVLYFGAKKNSFVAYAAFIFSVILCQFVWGGHIHLIFSEGIPTWLATHTEFIYIINGLCTGIFTINFLDTRKNAKTSHSLIIVLLWLYLFIGALCCTEFLSPMWNNNLVYGVSLLAIFSYIFAGFEAILGRFHPAKYFILAWGILAVGAIISLLNFIGFLPSNNFTSYCLQVGIFLQSALFSLALMEKSRSQLEREVEQASQDLRNNMELIEEQNARLDIARKDAIKASNVKSQFLANMSHEIRTPLNAILGFSRELANASLPPDQQEQVRIINSAADNLLTIVNDVLDFSKIEAGKLQISNQPFSPNKLLEELVSIMAKSAHSKKLEFVFDLGPLPEKLIGDVFRIKQILNNLLSNALKFTSSGSITLSVKGRPLPHGIHELIFTIEDTGIGISRQDRKKLFSAFSQVDDALNRHYQGTGLGLVITRKLVRLMRGELVLKSVPKQGSTFIVSIRTNHLSQKYNLVAHHDWQGKNVVIFDPVPATRQASAAMLSRLGAKVTSVESLSFLSTITQHADFLMATVPVYKLDKRDHYLQHFIKFPAKKRVLWYSGPDPFNQYPSLTQYFQTQIRMPMTLTKLDGLVKNKQISAHNPLQEKVHTLPKVRILAVDDMEMNLKLLHTWLDDSPVSLTTTTSGQDAVNQCQIQEFDLILMDVQMPSMDGLQASRHIRKTPLNMGTPIIAVTAHAFKEEQERLLASGMDDYLPKPISISSLIDIIRSWCHKAEPGQIILPTIDWQLALKRANQHHQAAKELLDEFIATMPDVISRLQSMWEQQDYEQMKTEIHKLHGGCCYTGVPRLQNITDELETALKLGHYSLVSEHLPVLIKEMEEVCLKGREHLNRLIG